MPDPITQKISKSHQRTASRLLAEAAAEAPVEHTEESPSPADLPAPLMDPAAITAAIEAGRYAADRRDSVEFLTRLAEGIAERIATYHKMAKDPRVAQLATLLSNIDVEKFTAFCPGHGAVLGGSHQSREHHPALGHAGPSDRGRGRPDPPAQGGGLSALLRLEGKRHLVARG
jgi:hypothetical protein